MLEASEQRIVETLSRKALVLDVGGWAAPMPRADWVLDVQPYATRGLYRPTDPASERFTQETWVQRDICDRAPWPFPDRWFDFAVCAHTLEDVRDPVWVCRELQRVARAGYVEVPSRAEEQTWGLQGEWVGWGHHHWLCDVRPEGIDFVFKHGVVAKPGLHRRSPPPPGDARVQTLWWDTSFAARERIFLDPAQLDAYLAEAVEPGAGGGPRRRRWRRWGRRGV